MRVGYSAFWWDDLKNDANVHACVESLRRVGYEAIEFKLDSFDLTADWGDQIAHAATIAHESELHVSNLVILRNLCAADDRARQRAVADVQRAIRAASQAGISILNTTTGGTPSTRRLSSDWYRPAVDDEAPAWDNLCQSLEPILDTAANEGVALALEPCIGHLVHDYHSMQELLRRMDTPALCMTFDPSHFFLYRNDIPAAVRALGHKIKHVHVKDAVGRPGEMGRDFLFPILGEGGIDFTSFFAALEEVAYDGVLCCEFESFKYMDDVLNNDPVRAAQLTYDAMQRLLARPRPATPG